MLKNSKFNEDKLYNKILLLSRNKFFYTELALSDTFQNRVSLIFMHIAFIFINMREKNDNIFYKKFSQKLFDLTFHKIELNMRELGYGDTQVNKKGDTIVKYSSVMDLKQMIKLLLHYRFCSKNNLYDSAKYFMILDIDFNKNNYQYPDLNDMIY